MKLPDHLFVSSTDGALHDTRMPDWSSHPLRADYSRTHSTIETTLQLRATLRAGAYAWPGGYQLYLVADDGEALCFDCVRTNYYQSAWSIRNKCSDCWRIVGCTTNDEDQRLYCAHCNNRIPSSYGDDDGDTE